MAQAVEVPLPSESIAINFSDITSVGEVGEGVLHFRVKDELQQAIEALQASGYPLTISAQFAGTPLVSGPLQEHLKNEQIVFGANDSAEPVPSLEVVAKVEAMKRSGLLRLISVKEVRPSSADMEGSKYPW